MHINIYAYMPAVYILLDFSLMYPYIFPSDLLENKLQKLCYLTF